MCISYDHHPIILPLVLPSPSIFLSVSHSPFFNCLPPLPLSLSTPPFLSYFFFFSPFFFFLSSSSSPCFSSCLHLLLLVSLLVFFFFFFFVFFIFFFFFFFFVVVVSFSFSSCGILCFLQPWTFCRTLWDNNLHGKVLMPMIYKMLGNSYLSVSYPTFSLKNVWFILKKGLTYVHWMHNYNKTRDLEYDCKYWTC